MKALLTFLILAISNGLAAQSGAINDWRYLNPGSYDHYHNFNVEVEPIPSWYNGEEGGAMSCDYAVYYVTKFPHGSWYRVRVVMEGATGNPSLGVQLAVWGPDNLDGPQSLYIPFTPSYTTGAGGVGPVLSFEVYMWIPEGVGAICVDGYGQTQGKFYLHVDRACTPDGELYMLPNPPQNPFDVQHQVILQ